MREVLRGACGAVAAGALSGALVGMGESVLVTWTSGTAEEYWLFLFGVLGYGVLGCLLGLGAAIAWGLARRGRAPVEQWVTVAAAVTVTLPAFVVGRYHVARRVFHEQLPVASLAGVVTHLLLLGGAVLAGVLAAWGARRLYRRSGLAGLLGASAGLVVLALGIGVATRPVSTGRMVRQGAGVAAGKANIILVICDTLRADALTPYGAAAEETPAIARLARDGVVFERAYAQATWTRPSIATILTSLYPSVHRTIGKMDFLPDDVETLAEAVRAEGYWTAGFVTNINVAPVFNFQQGFDEYDYLQPDFYFGASDSATKLSIYKILRVLRERFFSRRMYFHHYYQDAEVLEKHLVGWLDEQPPEPFFLLLHLMDPHDPYFEIPYNGHGVARVMTPSPPAETAPELRELYRQDVHYLDGYLEKIFARLRQGGLYDRTAIALVADHGEEFYEHGGWWHGTTVYNEVVHVPFIFKPAKGGGVPLRRSDPVRLIDVAPTLLAAAGLSIPPSFQGRDVATGPVDEPVLVEESLEGNELTAIIDGGWKLVAANRGNPRGLAPIELYHLDQDPGEREDLAGREPARVAELRAKMDSFQARVARGGGAPKGLVRGQDVADPRT